MQKALRYAKGGVHDHVARGVIDGDPEQQLGAACGHSDCLVDLAQQQCWDTIAPADDFQSHPRLPEFCSLQPQEGSQQPKNALNFGCGTAPVVRRKCVDGQTTDAHMRRVFHDALYGCDSGTMSCNPGQTAPRSPPPIAVHDDGHMQPGGLTLYRKVFERRERTLHCKVTSQKKVS